MTKKKQYKNRLPTVLPPAPRPAPEMESLPTAARAAGSRPAEVVQPAVTDRDLAKPDDAEPDDAEPDDAEPGYAEPDDAEPEATDPPPVAPPPATTSRSDAPSGPEPRSRRPLVGVLLLGPLVVLGVLLATWLSTRGDTSTSADDPASTTGQEPSAEVPDESYVETRVQRDGDIVVRHWIRAREPIDRITLSPPEVTGTVLSASRVLVLADDVRSAGPSTLTARGATYSFEESTDVELRYVLVGAVQRSESATGRALAVATTLDVRYSPGPARETRVVYADAVLSMACVRAGSSTQEPCGFPQDSDRWRVDLTGPDVLDRVVAQLTLQDPSTEDDTAAE